MATKSGTHDELSWFADSVANQNITANMSNLQLGESHHGGDEVALRNDLVCLFYINALLFSQTLSSFKLSPILQYPTAAAYFLSIQ